MTISKDLFLSLLSMDAYNRGYGAGISDPGAAIGSGLGTSTSTKTYKIGTATVGSDILLPSGSQAAGFYAIAYDDPVYGTIISYRGTDDENYLTGELTSVDLPISFGGSYEQTQIALAQRFFDAVDATNDTSPILLTGHSLGGALAASRRMRACTHHIPAWHVPGA